MLAGELYSPNDAELRKLHLRSKKLFGKYNKINPANEKKLKKLMCEENPNDNGDY